jgi:hypothetical protein
MSEAASKESQIAEVLRRFLACPRYGHARHALLLEGMRLTGLSERKFYRRVEWLQKGGICRGGVVCRPPRREAGTTHYPAQREEFLAVLKANPLLTVAEAARRANLPIGSARRATWLLPGEG